MENHSSKLILRHRQVGTWQMNTYALICPITQKSVLIDPGAESKKLKEMLAGSQPVAILLTHTHPDHIGALAKIRSQLDVPLMIHSGPHFGDRKFNADRHLDTGDQVTVGEFSLGVYYAPGHIDDQICFALENDNRVIVGDTIFEGGPGKTWSSEGFQQTLKTLNNVVLSWPDETVCYPGHGPHFRLGDKRGAIQAFLAKDHGDFFGDATWEM